MHRFYGVIGCSSSPGTFAMLRSEMFGWCLQSQGWPDQTFQLPLPAPSLGVT